MPDANKKHKDTSNKPDDQEARTDADMPDNSGTELGPPPLKADEEEPAVTDAKDEIAEDANEASPDLAPDVKDDADESDDGATKEPDPEAAADGEEDTPFDDEKTDKAIDEIMAKEADDILAAQDAAAAKGKVDAPRAKGGWWRKKWVWSVMLLLLSGGVAAALTIPASRYWTLNTAGVRSSSSVVVIDSTTRLPLKGVDVSLAGKQMSTDGEGKALFSEIKLGATQLVISQVGFEEIRRNVVIGWGSNPLGRFALNATGVQYVIEVTDYLSGQPLEGVEATNGSVTAVSSKDGKITLTLENTVVAKDSIALSKPGYRSESISLNEDPKKPTQVALTLSRKAVFVSKQSGTYDVYKSDIDGQNREVLLAGTGNENSNISLVVSQDGTRAAFVSTRDNKRDEGGFLLSSLTLINVENGSKLTIAEAAQIQLIDWVGTRLIFQLGSSSAGDEDRYTVTSYDYANNTRVQLAAARKLTAVVSAKGAVYYAVAADPLDESVQPGLFKIGLDGKGRQRVFDNELSSVLRSEYGTLSLQVADGTWYSYDLTTGAKTQTGTPASLASKLFIDNDERTKSLWVGQGTLRAYDVASGKDADVASVSGLTYPVQWAGAVVAIFRVSNASETADYAVSMEGGTPHKIADVTPTYGFSQAQ